MPQSYNHACIQANATSNNSIALYTARSRIGQRNLQSAICNLQSAIARGRAASPARCMARRPTMAVTTQSMTDEQRKSVALEYLKRLDRGENIFELFADDAQVYFPKW